MKSVAIQVWTALMLAAVPAGAQETRPGPEAALVVAISRTFGGLHAGNGFVVGDGTWVVTCDHLAFDKSLAGRHRLETFVSVYSPYLGEACDARVVATDEKLDLAVLQVAWKGHPAVVLADANEVLTARRGRVIGLASAAHRIDQWDTSLPQEELFRVDAEERSISFVGVRGGDPREVALAGHGQLGPGWSGSPLLQAGTNTALACFSSINTLTAGREHTVRDVAWGAAVSQVPRLLGLAPQDVRLQSARTWLPRPQDARAACSLALQTAGLLRSGHGAAALEPARALIHCRPDSAFAHKVLACASDDINDVQTARGEYRRALELDPNSLHTQLLYAQFLGKQGEPNAARQILEPLWRAGRARDLVAIALVSLFGERRELDHCREILDEAVRTCPRNAYLWQQMAACRLQAEGPAAAIEPITRAMELYPERGPFRAGLAELQEGVGALDEAERHFRKLLEIEPENPVVYYWLARFLSKHRPQAVPEALEVAGKALALPVHEGLPRQKIEDLIQSLRTQAPSTAEK